MWQRWNTFSFQTSTVQNGGLRLVHVCTPLASHDRQRGGVHFNLRRPRRIRCHASPRSTSSTAGENRYSVHMSLKERVASCGEFDDTVLGNAVVLGRAARSSLSYYQYLLISKGQRGLFVCLSSAGNLTFVEASRHTYALSAYRRDASAAFRQAFTCPLRAQQVFRQDQADRRRFDLPSSVPRQCRPLRIQPLHPCR